jgi:hypothetical protein
MPLFIALINTKGGKNKDFFFPHLATHGLFFIFYLIGQISAGGESRLTI